MCNRNQKNVQFTVLVILIHYFLLLINASTGFLRKGNTVLHFRINISNLEC